MNNIYSVAIVGGGASGLLCATELLLSSNAFLGSDIIVLEKNDRVGKKLIATGNGQGNIFNRNISIDNYHGDKGFINAFFKNFDDINLENYFKNLGIFVFGDEEGRVYPLSLQANSILDNLRYFLSSKNCTIKTHFCVHSIKKDGEIFIIDDGEQIVKAKNVVCAFGGASGKQFGTDGSSYKLLENFGHKLTKLVPSLVQLKVDVKDYKTLKGVKEKAKVYAFDGDKLLKASFGDLLFTEYGLSGNTIFKLSSYLQSAKKPNIKVEFLPSLSSEELLSIIKYREGLNYIPREDLLLGIVNKQLGRILCKKYNKIEDIVNALKGLPFEVCGDLGFNNAQVTKGGIDTDAVNPFTFQSKLVKNLFLTGEVLNVDGDCGGYNLAFAFISGIKVAKTIKEQRGF